MRVKYCTKCDTYFHRDILGAENIINAGYGMMKNEIKPDYLPVWINPNNANNAYNANNPSNSNLIDPIQEVEDPPPIKILNSKVEIVLVVIYSFL